MNPKLISITTPPAAPGTDIISSSEWIPCLGTVHSLHPLHAIVYKIFHISIDIYSKIRLIRVYNN